MKKTYIAPASMTYNVRLENMIATSIPKENGEGGIGDNNQGNFDFSPKEDSWKDGDWN